MKASLIRVAVEFPTDSEIRYLEQVPECGDPIIGRAHETYVVDEVRREGDGIVVFCVTPEEHGRHERDQRSIAELVQQVWKRRTNRKRLWQRLSRAA